MRALLVTPRLRCPQGLSWGGGRPAGHCAGSGVLSPHTAPAPGTGFGQAACRNPGGGPEAGSLGPGGPQESRGRPKTPHVQPVSLLGAEGALGRHHILRQTDVCPQREGSHTPSLGTETGGTCPTARPDPARPTRPGQAQSRSTDTRRGGDERMNGRAPPPRPVESFRVTWPWLGGGQRLPAARGGGSVPLTPAHGVPRGRLT